MVARRLACVIAAVSLSPAVAAAADDWSLTTADFQTRAVAVRGMTADGVQVAGPGGGERVVPLDTFVSAQRAAAGGASAATPKFTLALAGGDHLVGEPVTVTGENLTWAEPLLGGVQVPFGRLVAMNSGASASTPDERPKQDVVTLANGDSVAGVFTGVADGKLAVQAADGGPTAVPLGGVSRVAFASTGTPPADAGHAFRVRLVDGSAVTVVGVAVTGDGVSLTLAAPAGRVVPLPLVDVLSIEQLDGPVGWLSSRTPAESVQVPYLGGATPWPARFDAAVDGGPLAFNGQAFDHGIGVHAYSRLTFAIDPGWAAFRTRFAVDSRRDAPRLLADVTVRVKVDGRVALERRDVRAGVLSPVAVVDLTGAKTLTLECDYGPNGDTQAHLNWLEPALLRASPATRPSRP